MIDHLHFTVAANLIAVDAAKDWNVALIQESSGRRRSFRFANRFADHNEFVQCLHSLSGSVCIGLEPTGDFPRTIAFRLLSEGFQVVSISSLALSRFREARFGNWDKNDPKDAQVMLAMMGAKVCAGLLGSAFQRRLGLAGTFECLFSAQSSAYALAAQPSVAPLATLLSGVYSLLAFHPIGMVHSLSDCPT